MDDRKWEQAVRKVQRVKQVNSLSADLSVMLAKCRRPIEYRVGLVYSRAYGPPKAIMWKKTSHLPLLDKQTG